MIGVRVNRNVSRKQAWRPDIIETLTQGAPVAEMIRFLCPGCQKRLKAPETAAGRRATCQKCGMWMLVPGPSGQGGGRQPGPPRPSPLPSPTTSPSAPIYVLPADDDSTAATGRWGASSASAHDRSDNIANKRRLYLAMGGVLSLVLATISVVAILFVVYDRDSTSGGPTGRDYKSTLDCMATEVTKSASVHAKNNQLASEKADKAMHAELAKINGTELTWKFEVAGVNQGQGKVDIYHKYMFRNDGSLISGSEAVLSWNDPTMDSRSRRTVGHLTCFVWPAKSGSTERKFIFPFDSIQPGTYLEIGNLVPPATADKLTKGDFVTIKGKARLELDKGTWTSHSFILHFEDTKFVDSAKGSSSSITNDEPSCEDACRRACPCCGGTILSFAAIFGIFVALVYGPAVVGMWKTFAKAGEPGWTALIPIYNLMVMAKIAGKGEAYGLLCLIPIAGIVFLIVIIVELCKKFDIGGGFAWGVILLPLIFWPILGFGSARYIGDRAASSRRRSNYRDEEDERSF